MTHHYFPHFPIRIPVRRTDQPEEYCDHRHPETIRVEYQDEHPHNVQQAQSKQQSPPVGYKNDERIRHIIMGKWGK
jgi:hypothetical protein